MPSSPLPTTTSPGARPVASALSVGVGDGLTLPSDAVAEGSAVTSTGCGSSENTKVTASQIATATPSRADAPITKSRRLRPAGAEWGAVRGVESGGVTVQD